VDRTVAKALLDSVTNRQECNRVTGCRRERELVALGPEVLPLIVERFKEMRGSNYQRLHLVELAGDAGRGRAVPFLVELLDDTDRNIRAAAAVALGRLRPTALAAQLRQRLAKVAATRDFGFTYGLAFAVERADRRGGRSILLAALSPQSLGNVNPGDLAIAVAAVTDLGLSEACPLLPPFITQPEVFLKKEAIRAARTLLCRQDEVTEAVALDLENAVPSVRREAAQALETLTSTRFATREQWRAWKAARTAR
jgi:HEAT repeat protein